MAFIKSTMKSSNHRGATVVMNIQDAMILEHPAFELINAQAKKYVFESAKIRIGAGPGNDLVLKDPTVSAVHLEIQINASGIKVIDLQSTNGTRINDVRIDSGFIEDGQILKIGSVPLKFQLRKEKVKEKLSAVTSFHGVVGQSAAMRTVFSRIERAAKSNATVLIDGETGTGKEVVSWAVYEASLRADKAFVVIDCGGIARNLIESELFGHEKGAFTGAHSRRIGAFERANGGTIFLDELGELELDLQPKLLRVLENKSVQRLGGHQQIPIDVRVIAASNRDLRAMVARGEFREDLYYRLAVVPLSLPPLRDRKEDIPLLVELFLKNLSASMDDFPKGLVDKFQEYHWPGNVRELKNAVERSMILGENKFEANLVVESPSEKRHSVQKVDTDTPYKEQKLERIAEFEEAYARAIIEEFSGNVSKAARKAGIDRMSLHKILSRYFIDPKEYS